MLARTSRPELNCNRLALYFADECHKYAIGGATTAGDPYFMNLSRSNNVVNICATQSYAWLVDVLGRDTANVYISAFGVQFWLQQTDPETCKRAAEICGTVIQEDLQEYHFCTAKPDGINAVRCRVREYYREILENITHERGEAETWSSLITS